jgi:hypothetical protein
MGIGTALAFVAIGAILAFAFHFHVSGIDIQMIGWILIFVGIAMLLITLLYTRPRRRRRVVQVADGQPGAYVSQVEDQAVVGQPVVEEAVVEQPVYDEPVVEQPVARQPQARPAPRQRRDVPPSGLR